MPLLDGAIQTRSYELVRDRIATILADELPNQATLRSDTDLDATVYLERFVPFDKTEVPAVNVSLYRGDYNSQSAIHEDGTYLFNIDCYHRAKSTANASNGDSAAMVKLHKLTGVCQAILEDPRYKTLGFTAPFVMNRHVVSIAIADPGSQDAVSVVMSRITFSVRLPENHVLIDPAAIGCFTTQVKLGLTEKGYVFSSCEDTPGPVPESYCGEVTVNDVFFGYVQEGEVFNVIVVDTNGDPVGEKIGDVWMVPAAGACAYADVTNSDGSYTASVASGATLNLPDVTYNIILNGALNQSFTSPALTPTLNINIYG